LLIAAIVVFVAGVALAVAQPGDLGGKTTTSRAASTTTKPSTTGSTTGTTTGTSLPGTSIAPQSTGSNASSSSSSTASSSGATTTTVKSGSTTTTTITSGGLGQSGAGGAGGATHPITGGTSMLALGLVMMLAAFVLRRSSTATA
jgi:hypothetical protein